MNAPRPQTPARPGQLGFSLVEVLVALAIGLFLSAGILQLFSGTRQTYRFEEALSRIQENGRYALEAIARDVRMVGFLGCSRLEYSVESVNVIANNVEFSATTLITDEIEDTVADDLASGTDYVRLRRLSDDAARVSADMAGTGGPIPIASNPGGFEGDDILAISDCEQIDVFEANTVSSSSITLNSGATLSKAYGEDSRVMQLRDVTYYITDGRELYRSRHVANAATPSAQNIKEELIEDDGIEDLWIRYGTPDGYLDIGSVTDWSEVRSIRIELLLASDAIVSGGLDQPPIPWRNGAFYCDGQFREGSPDTSVDCDGHLRQVFSTTIALRNRLI